MTKEAPFDFDTRLMLQLRHDDTASFELLLERHRTVVQQYVSRKVQNEAVAEELAQDVFVRVYRARHAYVPTAKFNTWLYRIVTNVVLNHFRDERHGNQNISLDAPTAAGVYFETPERRHSVEQRLVREEVAREVLEAIHGLPDKQRAAVLMHKYRNLDYNEIAGILRMSLPAVKALMFRAYERLRSQLAHLDTNGPKTPAAQRESR